MAARRRTDSASAAARGPRPEPPPAMAAGRPLRHEAPAPCFGLCRTSWGFARRAGRRCLARSGPEGRRFGSCSTATRSTTSEQDDHPPGDVERPAARRRDARRTAVRRARAGRGGADGYPRVPTFRRGAYLPLSTPKLVWTRTPAVPLLRVAARHLAPPSRRCRAAGGRSSPPHLWRDAHVLWLRRPPLVRPPLVPLRSRLPGRRARLRLWRRRRRPRHRTGDA